MRITFVIFSLAAGGAERVASTLVNHWASAGEEVTLVTIDARETDFFPLHPQVERVALGLTRKSHSSQFLTKNFQRVRQLRRVICTSRPDVVVSFLDFTNVLVLLATIGSGLPVVVSERTDPTKNPVGKVVTALRWLLYPLARALVFQTDAVGLWALGFMKSRTVWVIPNPARPMSLTNPGSTRSSTGRIILAMGRMVPAKGFDLLLSAFAHCASRCPDWRLRIVGEGPDREALRILANRLGLKSRVAFDSTVRDPVDAFLDADLFVLSSRFEGFPNVLLEAMACGLPVISFDCRSGPREIIRDGLDGILVPPNDVEALAEAMVRLMRAGDERRRLGARAIEVTDRFSLTKVSAMWREVLNDAVGQGSAQRNEQLEQRPRLSKACSPRVP
jgi:GalNAc-alpha-(1->4)-GalNAc-alpha-(1->3)-diNAcBac-PP-undecaprenol alpha-1,4-N-acetyl-D-galactosaminyltransferase